MPRQLEIRELLDRTELLPIDPDKLPKRLRPLVDELNGQTVLQFGIYTVGSQEPNGRERVGGAFRDVFRGGAFEFASDEGGVNLTAEMDLDAMLDVALETLEDDQRPVYVCHTARMVCEAISALKTLPPAAPRGLLVGLAVALGSFFERMHVEQLQHFAKDGRTWLMRQRIAASAPKKPGRWERRCQLFRQLKKTSTDSKFEICRQIAQTELKRRKNEGFEKWQQRVMTRQRTIFHDIDEQLKKHPSPST